jgi:hypothetical protein
LQNKSINQLRIGFIFNIFIIKSQSIFKMKKILLLLFIGLLSLSSYSQDEITYESALYINDLAIAEIPRFVKLHKKFTDMSLGENRTMTGEWVFRHWYGSGHTFVIYTQYASMDDFHKDADLANQNIKAKIDATEDASKKETLMQEWAEYRSFANGHSDEVRAANSKTGFYQLENTDFDIPFAYVVGKYNSSGSWKKMGNAFFDWRIKDSVDSGTSMSGGVSYHYMGSSSDVEVWQCYTNLVEFAKSVTAKTTESEEAIEAKKTFWSLVDGAHEDQIYVHIGHVNLEKGIFDLAGKDR